MLISSSGGSNRIDLIILTFRPFFHRSECRSTVPGALAMPGLLQVLTVATALLTGSAKVHIAESDCDSDAISITSSMISDPVVSPSSCSMPDLVVAKQVVVGGDCMYFTTAKSHQHSNNKQTSYHQKRLVKLLVLSGLIFTAIVCVAVGVVCTNHRHQEWKTASPLITTHETTPSEAPVAVTLREEEIIDELEQLVGGPWQEGIDIALAAEWIIHEDGNQLDATSPNLHQRFLLAYLYLSTGPWTSCNYFPDDEEPLDGHCNNFGLPYNTTKHFGRWLSPTSECTWAGAICEDGETIRRLYIGTFDMVSHISLLRVNDVHSSHFDPFSQSTRGLQVPFLRRLLVYRRSMYYFLP
jgi:hypothetical protein